MSDDTYNASSKGQWAEWVTTVLEPALASQLEEPPEGQGIALLAADTDRTQDYVFESARLPEIRGASLLLTQLNEETPDERVKQTIRGILGDYGLDREEVVIYAGGGSLLALVPEAIADDLIRDIESLYPRETGLATITCVSMPVSPAQIHHGVEPDWTYEALMELQDRLTESGHPTDWQRVVTSYEVDGSGSVTREGFDSGRGFGQLVALAGQKLRRAKEEKTWVPFHEAVPFAFRCRSCQIRPAEQIVQLLGETWQVCNVCARKQEERREVKGRWVEEFEAYLNNLGESQRKRYYGRHHPSDVGVPAAEGAHDLNEIGQASRARSGYVGFIYADGNSVGEYMQAQTSPADYQDVSKDIRDVTSSAVYEALASHLHPTEVQRRDWQGRPTRWITIHPFEILTIGGDDLLLIVPGDTALPVAMHICQAFRQRVPGNLTISTGVVIAQDSNPIRFLRDLAYDLLKNSAKPLARECDEATLDFLVLKSQSMVRTGVKELRESKPYRFEGEDAGTYLYSTARPYTLKDARQLLHLLKFFQRRDFPTSQLHSLTYALRDGRSLSSLFYLYQRARLDERAKPLKELELRWEMDPYKDPAPPWRAVEEDGEFLGFETVLLDLAELYPFVPRQPNDDAWDALWQVILDTGGV